MLDNQDQKPVAQDIAEELTQVIQEAFYQETSRTKKETLLTLAYSTDP
jgi:hypothetical protein